MSRSGWCPECEKEGKDPRHGRSTILCSLHHQRKRRQERPKAARCEECAKEGRDPYHKRTISDGPCDMHYMRRYRQTDAGKEATSRYSQSEQRKQQSNMYGRSEAGRRAKTKWAAANPYSPFARALRRHDEVSKSLNHEAQPGAQKAGEEGEKSM